MVDTEQWRDEHKGFPLRLGSPTENQHSGRQCWCQTLGRVRVSGRITPSEREQRKTSSKLIAIPLLMTVILLIVVKVMRGLWMFDTITTSRKELGIIPLLLMTMTLVLKVVRGLRVRDQ